MIDWDDTCTITCGKCKQTAPVLEWLRCREDALHKLYLDGYCVCPNCKCGFRRSRKFPREPGEPYIQVVEVDK